MLSVHFQELECVFAADFVVCVLGDFTRFHRIVEEEGEFEIIFDLIDEIVDVVRPPRFVHMGHDEIYQIGLCPKCKGTPHDVLYERHIKALHEHLAKKNLRMMIWADMLQPTEKRYSTCTAINRLPKDIVLLDFIWYFHFDLDMEDHLLPSGYEVLMGNLYSSHYPRYESRAAKERMIGGQVSTWCRMDEYTLSKKGKLYDLLYTAEMLWSPSYRENAREAYADILAKRIPALRDRIHGEKRQIARAYAPIALPAGEGKVARSIADVCGEVSLAPRRLSTPLHVPAACRLPWGPDEPLAFLGMLLPGLGTWALEDN